MAGRTSLRAELEALRKEVEALREPAPKDAPAADEGKPAFTDHLEELNRLVRSMLEEAEETISEHPVATVAGALALGIVIGQLTARVGR